MMKKERERSSCRNAEEDGVGEIIRESYPRETNMVVSSNEFEEKVMKKKKKEIYNRKE